MAPIIEQTKELEDNRATNLSSSFAPQQHPDPDALIGTVIDQGISVLKPAAPSAPADDNFHITGLVWWFSLSSDQANDVSAFLATVGNAASAAAGPLWPAVAAAMTAASVYISVVNKLGGENGVDVNGVVGWSGVVVTPRVGAFYGDLIQAARLAATGRTIVDFLVLASSEVPAVAAAFNLPVVGAVLTAVESGTPLGWALAGALGLFVDLLSSAPDPNAHGHIWADRTQPQAWESFLLGQLGSGNKVSLLSWQGLFSAQGGGGGDVYANRPQVGDWETFTLIDNGDGTISFQTQNNNYLSAQLGGGTGSALYANRTAIGDWEKFYLVNMPDGKHIALKTFVKGTYVSVQQ